MTCLTPQQLAQLALRAEADAGLAVHAQECPACREALSQMRLLVDNLDAAHARVNRTHAESRARLMAEISSIDVRRPERFQQLLTWIGETSMKQRILFGSTATAALVMIALWAASSTKPAFALEEVAKNIREAKSYSADMIMEVSLVREPGKPPVTDKSTGRLYWLAPGSVRMEFVPGEFHGGSATVSIFPKDRAGITFDHTKKSYRTEPPRRGQSSPMMMINALGSYSKAADRELGNKDVGGKRAHGFAIAAKKVDPSGPDGNVEVWVDSDSGFPVELIFDFKRSMPPLALRFVNFRWNADLDPKLFDLSPPEGYADATPKPDSPDIQAAKIAEALKLYAELSGGHYPRVKIVYGDVTRDEMLKLAGFQGQPTIEQLRDEKYQNYLKITKAVAGLATANAILRDNDDAAYHGISVGPNDKDKVLLRWKLEDGKYQVMYGDLRTETLTAEKLRAAEGG